MNKKIIAADQSAAKNLKRKITLLALRSVWIIFSLLSLSTYSPTDKSFNVINSDKVINLMGFFGSYFSDIVLQTFGLGGYLIVFHSLIFLFYEFKVIGDKSLKKLLLKYSFCFVNIISFCLAVAVIKDLYIYQFLPGGFVGLMMKEGLSNYLPVWLVFILSSLLFTITLLGIFENEIEIAGFIARVKKIFTFAGKISTMSMLRNYKPESSNLVDMFALKKDKRKQRQRSKSNLRIRKDEIIGLRQQDKAQDNLYLKKSIDSGRKYCFDINLLKKSTVEHEIDSAINHAEAEGLMNALNSFGIRGEYVKNINGQNINSYIVKIPAAVNRSRIKGLSDDLKRKIGVSSLFIVETGKDLVEFQVSRLNEADEKEASQLEEVLKDFGIEGRYVKKSQGPVVHAHYFELKKGIKVSRVIGLSDDIALRMRVSSIRVSSVPEENLIRISVPSSDREMIKLRSILDSKKFISSKSSIPLALGLGITGDVVLADLAKMPHLMIAGTTGSGKSVGLNGMIVSMLYKLPPNKCQFVMIDPKILELSVYENVPHLIRFKGKSIITEPQDAIHALKWLISNMLSRYRMMRCFGVKNIGSLNEKISMMLERSDVYSIVNSKSENADGAEISLGGIKINKKDGKTFTSSAVNRGELEEEFFELKELPYIVIIIDEIADLMMVAGKEVEGLIQRLAQMARAAGIHMIIATQRPSVDVITGVIKANFPSRISYSVNSKIDSRTILGEGGAEQLLGAGDMLFMGTVDGASSSMFGMTRVHGPFVEDSEIAKIVADIKKNFADFNGIEVGEDEFSEFDESSDSGTEAKASIGAEEDVYNQAVKIVVQSDKPTISYLQRRMRIGYNKAANLIEQMEEDGIISPPSAGGKRTVIKKD